MSNSDDPLHLQIASKVGSSLAKIGGTFVAFTTAVLACALMVAGAAFVYYADSDTLAEYAAKGLVFATFGVWLAVIAVLLFIGTFAPEKASAMARWLGGQAATVASRSNALVPSIVKRGLAKLAAAMSWALSMFGRVIEAAVEVISVAFPWALGILLGSALIYFTYSAIASLPLSVAVIIGAFIIAGALRK
jgi:hypothetical protein